MPTTVLRIVVFVLAAGNGVTAAVYILAAYSGGMVSLYDPPPLLLWAPALILFAAAVVLVWLGCVMD